MKNFKEGGLIVAALIVILAVFSMTSCQDLGVLMSQLDDEVKLANDRYLKVEQTFPEQNDNNLSPRMEILVNFDRDVDPEIIGKYIKIEQRGISGIVSEFGDKAEEEISISFNPVDKTLILSPEPFLNGGDKIIISLLPGAPAIDGSVLRDLFAWSFYTVKMPVGVLDIADGSDVTVNTLAGYTNDPTPELSIVYSNSGEYFLTDLSATADSVQSDDSVWELTSVKSGGETVNPVDFPFNWGGDAFGSKTIYAVFKDPNSGTISLAESDTVYFDENPPTSVNGGANVTSFTNQSVTRTVTYSETGSGFQKALWTSADGATFSPSDGVTTVIRGPSGQHLDNMPIVVRVYDNAGNLSTSDTVNIDWDSLAPDRPSILTFPAPATGYPYLSWSWSPAISVTGHVSDGYTRQVGLTPLGSKTSWTTANTTSTSYGITISKSSSPLPVGIYLCDFRVMELDTLGNASDYESASRVTFQSVRPYYGSAVNYIRKTILAAVLTVDWPGYPGGLSFLESYLAEYRKVGSGVWKTATIDSRGGSSATIPIGADINNRTGNYEWRYQVRTKLTGVYESPVFTFSVTNS